MGILDSIGSFLGDEENRLNLASGFAGMSGNPNAGNIQQGYQNRLTALRGDRKLESAKELEASKLANDTKRALQLLGEFPDIADAVRGGFLSPNAGVTEARKRKAAGPKDRRIIKGADGYNYFEDGTRALPNAVAPADKGTPVMQNFDFYKSQGKTDDEALTMATTVRQTDPNAQTAGQKEVDKKYATDYVIWTQGGGSDMTGQLAQIGGVLSQLESGVPLTGPIVGALGSWGDLALSVLNPEASNAKEKVQEVVQRNLRIILGAQFTAKEGEQLISRAYNSALPPKINAERLRKLVLQMTNAVEQKNAMSAYFEDKGTLTGYTGKRPKLNDFYEAISGVMAGTVYNGQKFIGGDHMDKSNWVTL